MDTSKYTTGPWHITHDTTPNQFGTLTKVRDKHEGVICVCHVLPEFNSHLIAAAPELLENLKIILDCLRLGYNVNECADEIKNAIEVIAKATNQNNEQ